MRIHQILAVSMLTSLSVQWAAKADPLDAPAVKVVTVRTEIARGSAAEMTCSLKPNQTYSTYADCFQAILQSNTQANTDTDAFDVGFFVGVNSTMALFESAETTSTSDKDMLSEDHPRAFKEYIKFRDKLGLTDAQVCEAANAISCPPAKPTG